MDRKQTRASCEYIWQSLIYKHLKRFILVSSPRHATITFNRLINVAYHPSDFCRLSQSLYIFSTSWITDRNQCVISMNEFRLFHCFIETVSPFVLRDILSKKMLSLYYAQSYPPSLSTIFYNVSNISKKHVVTMITIPIFPNITILVISYQVYYGKQNYENPNLKTSLSRFTQKKTSITSLLRNFIRLHYRKRLLRSLQINRQFFLCKPLVLRNHDFPSTTSIEASRSLRLLVHARQGSFLQDSKILNVF